MFRSFKGLMMIIAHVVAYTWIKDDEHLDAVAGISLWGGEPVCTGVFISSQVILTSANPLESLIQVGRYLKVSQVIYAYNESDTYVARMAAYNQSNRDAAWVRVGFNLTHSTIHDFMLLTIEENRYYLLLNLTTYSFRRKFSTPVATMESYYSPEDVWYFAGFGFVDKEDLNDSTTLEVEYLNANTRADCDEWIPREWGRFLCFHDFNNLAGVPSGAPLYHGSNFIPGLSPVYGLGAFSLIKGKDTILVFTDLRAYTHKIHYDSMVTYDGTLETPFLPYVSNVGPIIPSFVHPYRKLSSGRH